MLLCFPSTQLALKRHGARLKRLTFATSPAPRSFLKEGPFKRSSDGDAAAAADGAIDVEQDQNAQEVVAVLAHTIYCVSAPFTACVSFTVCV